MEMYVPFKGHNSARCLMIAIEMSYASWLGTRETHDVDIQGRIILVIVAKCPTCSTNVITPASSLQIGGEWSYELLCHARSMCSYYICVKEQTKTTQSSVTTAQYRPRVPSHQPPSFRNRSQKMLATTFFNTSLLLATFHV